jgi:peptidoglycan/xylan/chitin deacetylase (PgdA/CDA1 family)
MKPQLKRAFLALLRASLLPVVIRETLQKRGVTVLLYHQVRPEVLDRHLAVLGRRYRFISLREYLDARRRGTLGSLPPKSLVITLDDGHASNRDLLPVFRRHGIRPTVFVCTGLVGTRRHFWFEDSVRGPETQHLKTLPDAERLARLAEHGFEEDREYETRQALSWEEMEEMRASVDFQSHTMYHPILVRCDRDRARREISQSKADLEARGFPAYALAYPNGDYSEATASLVREAGYECALSADLGFNRAGTDPYRLKRITIRDEAGTAELLVRASGLWGAVRTAVKGRP